MSSIATTLQFISIICLLFVVWQQQKQLDSLYKNEIIRLILQVNGILSGTEEDELKQRFIKIREELAKLGKLDPEERKILFR